MLHLQTSAIASNGNHELHFSVPILDDYHWCIYDYCFPTLQMSHSNIFLKQFVTAIVIAIQFNSKLMSSWLGPHPLSHLPAILLSPIGVTNALPAINITSYETISAAFDFYLSILSFLSCFQKEPQDVSGNKQLHYPPTQPSISKATVPFLVQHL